MSDPNEDPVEVDTETHPVDPPPKKRTAMTLSQARELLEPELKAVLARTEIVIAEHRRFSRRVKRRTGIFLGPDDRSDWLQYAWELRRALKGIKEVSR